MGKFQSKLASKRRQGPEGGSLASKVLTCQSEPIHIHKSKVTQNLYVELRDNRSDLNCNHNVVLPPEKTPDMDKSTYIQVNKQIKKKKIHVADTECSMVSKEDPRKEWVFTLYNFGTSGKDMSNLIHSMYEVLDASVKQPHAGHTPLKIELAVTATAYPDKMSQTETAAEKEHSTSQKVGGQIRKLYCMDENIERRNHYLDLAGIENYTSKFDNTEPPSQEPREQAHSAVQHHAVVATKNCMSPRGLLIPDPLNSKATSVRNDRSRGDGKACKHPSSWCHLTQSHPPAHSVLQRSHSRRPRSKVQDAATHLTPTPGKHREILSNLQPSCGVPLVQRHEHHHYHEHHHHHHHHYHPS